MAQHFFMSAAARTLSRVDLCDLSEDAAISIIHYRVARGSTPPEDARAGVVQGKQPNPGLLRRVKVSLTFHWTRRCASFVHGRRSTRSSPCSQRRSRTSGRQIYRLQRRAVLGPTATTAPTQRDSHIRSINKHGRMNWQKTSGGNRRSKVEAANGRYKRVIRDALRSREDARRQCEVTIAVKVLNRMLELGRPVCVRVA